MHTVDANWIGKIPSIASPAEEVQIDEIYVKTLFSSSMSGAELGSRYAVESGVYMNSFTAAIFVAGLVTAGVLLLTLLITLTVMLQLCQSKSNGAVEMWRSSSSSSFDDFSYCRILASNMELNGLNVDSLPSFCESVAIKYIKEGQYAKELNITVSIIENYLGSVRPQEDGLDVVLVDLDDFLPSDYSHLIQPRQHTRDDYIEEAKRVKSVLFQHLCMNIEAGGWPLIFLSRKSEKLRNATREHLSSAGCGGYSSLFMRHDEEMQMNATDYFAERRISIEKEGLRITAVISSHMDALTGPCLGKRMFKLPNPIYYKRQKFVDSAERHQYILQE